MTRVFSTHTPQSIGQVISVAGWVNARRDHGGLIFIDVRDHAGIVQLVINPEQAESFNLAETVRDEYVIRAEGTVKERKEGLKNPNIPTGDVEIVIDRLELLNKSEPLPVATKDEGQQSGEELRLRYRYLDLRRPSMQQMLKQRSKYYTFLRNYMDEHDFPRKGYKIEKPVFFKMILKYSEDEDNPPQRVVL